jgi:hypothetical protein
MPKKEPLRNKMSYRVGILTKQGNILGQTFQTRAEVDDYILQINEKEGVKRADIINQDTKEREKVEL